MAGLISQNIHSILVEMHWQNLLISWQPCFGDGVHALKPSTLKLWLSVAAQTFSCQGPPIYVEYIKELSSQETFFIIT